MDPDRNLLTQLQLAKNILHKDKIVDDAISLEIADDAVALAELVLALDSWLTGGGFTPDRWAQAAKRRSQGW